MAGASAVVGVDFLVGVLKDRLLPVSEDRLSVDLEADVRLPPKLGSEATAVIVSTGMDLSEELERLARKIDFVRVKVLSAELEDSLSVVADATPFFPLFLAADVLADVSSD